MAWLSLQTHYGEYYNDRTFYAPESFSVYRPIYAGDMNLGRDDFDYCGNFRQHETEYQYFEDPNATVATRSENGYTYDYWYTGHIDRIWLGRRSEFPESQNAKYTFRYLTRQEHQEDDYECFFDVQYYNDPNNCYCEDIEDLTYFRCSKVGDPQNGVIDTHGFETRARLMSDHPAVMIELIAEEINTGDQ